MKNLKKNNKGFSLVELIVVVLIMAIIAVALAPQIMKWVKNSRITADQNACGNLKSATQAGIADFQAKSGKIEKAMTYTINDATSLTAAAQTGEAEPDAVNGKTLIGCINDALGDEKYKTKYDNGGFTVHITAAGGVTVTCGASNITLD